jgi:UDP-N-acetylmuramate: L-alanyl-gamma-D-glutamyl-meso-diaminopimelate ligase
VDEVIIGQVHAPEKAPEGDRFDPDRLAADLRGKGVAARFVAEPDAIAAHVAERAAPGDTVVVMSSGGFGGVHDRILARLGMAVTDARSGDAPAVKALLDRASLPYPDLEQHIDDLIVLRDGEVVGCVALERYQDDALLRSLAVVPERRGEGLGWLLAEAALQRARQRGALRVVLLTDTATDFFAEKFGFKAVDRALLSPALLASSQFRAARSAQATTMKLDL